MKQYQDCLFDFIGHNTLFWWAGLPTFDKPCHLHVQKDVTEQQLGFSIKEFHICHSLMALNYK
jgi:hypothetical protein